MYCSECKHSTEDHEGGLGRCHAFKKKHGRPSNKRCKCLRYSTPAGSSQGPQEDAEGPQEGPEPRRDKLATLRDCLSLCERELTQVDEDYNAWGSKFRAYQEAGTEDPDYKRNLNREGRKLGSRKKYLTGLQARFEQQLAKWTDLLEESA